MSYTGNLAPIGNRTQAKCFKRIHLTTIPSALISHHELIRACSLPGFETRTSCTQSRNHTTRPNGQRRTSHVYCNYIHLQFIWILHFYPSIPKDWCTHSGAKEARWVELEVELKLEGSTASNRHGPNRLLITSDQGTPNDKQKTKNKEQRTKNKKQKTTNTNTNHFVRRHYEYNDAYPIFIMSTIILAIRLDW